MGKARSISTVCRTSRIGKLGRPLHRGLIRVFWFGVLAASVCVALPAAGGADATVASPPTPSSASGLPDGRLYEEVSPANKNGNYVASGHVPITEYHGYAAASADGNALVFVGSGAMGEAVSGVLGPYVARRVSSGWSTRSATPPQLGVTSVFGTPRILVPSSNLSTFVFGSWNRETRYSPEEPAGPVTSMDIYLTEDPFLAPAWLGKPTIANPIPMPGENKARDFFVVGATPSLSTVYFTYSGTLIEQDEPRAANVGSGEGEGTDPWGFYEWSAGKLAAAGVLPNGTLSPFGAVPAALAGNGVPGSGILERDASGSGWQAADFNNEVSADGSKAFFVSPDPLASTVTNPEGCEGNPSCTSAPPELYVRETAADGSKSTVLVSQSQLAGHLGEAAPDGPVFVTDATVQGGALDSPYVYASADGSQAFFASTDFLTKQAEEENVAGSKEYDFDLKTGALTYLPHVVGPIVASSQNGSDFIFGGTTGLDLWSAGPGGGSVTPIAQLPEPPTGEPERPKDPYGTESSALLGVEGRASSDGSVFVFDTDAPVPGGFNNQTRYGEVYRYEVPSEAFPSGRLACVSCPPVGVTPSGNAFISYDNAGGRNGQPRSTVGTRAMSSDGSRVFFDTPDPLVPQDVNGKRDVYMWENGTIYLISSGTSSEDSSYLDNSSSGGDVFFNTTSGLLPGDADDAYDAYDARIPRSGDTPPPAAVPCAGEVCQGPPSVPSLLGLPASATFNGAGNVAPVESSKAPVKKKVVKKKVVKKKPKHRRKRGRRARRSRVRARKSDTRRGL